METAIVDKKNRGLFPRFRTVHGHFPRFRSPRPRPRFHDLGGPIQTRRYRTRERYGEVGEKKTTSRVSRPC